MLSTLSLHVRKYNIWIQLLLLRNQLSWDDLRCSLNLIELKICETQSGLTVMEKSWPWLKPEQKYFRKPVSLKTWREKEVNDILISDLCAFHTDHRDAGIHYNFQFSFIYVTSLHKMLDVHETHMFTLFCNMRMFFQLPLKKRVFGTISLTWYWIRMFRKGLSAQSTHWINIREIKQWFEACYYRYSLHQYFQVILW